MYEYRFLKEGEIVQKGDEVDMCRDGWRDTTKWITAKISIGKKAPNPHFPSHRKYRRKLKMNIACACDGSCDEVDRILLMTDQEIMKDAIKEFGSEEAVKKEAGRTRKIVLDTIEEYNQTTNTQQEKGKSDE